MKNKIISSRLWIEGLRRLRIPGFISLAFIGISAILVPASNLIGVRLTYDPSVRDKFISAGTSVHPGLVLLTFVVAPVMALTLFSFLNKRRSADFFHSLPYSRACIFTSFFLSIVTWLCFIAVSTSALNLAAYAVFGFRGALAQILRILPQVIIGSILACASVTLAMTLTGTLFSNLTVSALILYFPKVCAGLFATGVTEAVRIIPLEYYPLCRFLRYNLATSALPFTDGPYVGKEMAIALVYSSVLAIAYFALSCVLFVKRKSETAERSAPNRAVQTVFRIAVTMVICMPVCTLLLFNVRGELYLLVPVLFLYTVALTVWVLWEIITTKRWINVLKSLPYLGIVVVLNVAVILGLYAAKNAALNFTPAPEEIKSVTVVTNRQFNYYTTLDMIDYADTLKGDRVITNENSLKTVSEVLSRTANTIKKTDGYSYESDNECYALLRIDTARGVRYRELAFTSMQYKSLTGGLENGPSGEETRIPEPIDGSVYISGLPELNNSDTNDAILATMRDELKNADVSEWRDFLLSVDESDTVNVEFGSIVNGSYMRIRVPMNRKFMPEASDEFLAAVGDLKNTDLDDAMEEVEKIIASYRSYDPERSDNDYYSFTYDYNEYVIVLDKATGQYLVTYNWDYSEVHRKEVIDGITDKLPTGEDSFYVVSIHGYDRDTGEETEKTYVSAITDEAAETALEVWHY